tara:strand:- start:576 stop:773 length:198 start_codon:yes stop_codon:yes gene_type:complete
MDGLTIKGGRLINNRPEPESGIARAARLRKELKNTTLIESVAGGIELAQEREEVREMISKMLKRQ